MRSLEKTSECGIAHTIFPESPPHTHTHQTFSCIIEIKKKKVGMFGPGERIRICFVSNRQLETKQISEISDLIISFNAVRHTITTTHQLACKLKYTFSSAC